MHAEIVATPNDPPLQPFHILFKRGECVTVKAYTYRITGAHIKFYNSETLHNEQIFLRERTVDCILAGSSVDEAPQFQRLQSQVENLEKRVFTLETNLADIVTRAVAAAFAQRGL